MDFLQGKKTYILAILVGLAAACQYLGYVTPETAQFLLGLFGAGAVASLRFAVGNKS